MSFPPGRRRKLTSIEGWSVTWPAQATNRVDAFFHRVRLFGVEFKNQGRLRSVEPGRCFKLSLQHSFVRIRGVCAALISLLQTRSHDVNARLAESFMAAQLVREATLLERRRYLELLPLVRMVLCCRKNGVWLAVPAESVETLEPSCTAR